MTQSVSESPAERVPLSRERVLRGAVAVADAAGIGALTMRSLATELGVKPMSLYRYVGRQGRDPGRHRLDLVFSEIELPAADGDWRSQMRRSGYSPRERRARTRQRSLESSTTLRIRTVDGVTSTHSSSRQNSSACSRLRPRRDQRAPAPRRRTGACW